MVTNTNLKYADSSSNYYVIMMLQNLKKLKKLKISNFFRIPETRGAELKQSNKRSALVINNLASPA